MEGMTIGERLRWLREKRGLSPGQLAYLAGISRNYVWKIEQDYNRSVGAVIIAKLADALNTTPDYLMGATDDPSPRVEEGRPVYLDLQPAALELAERLSSLPEPTRAEVTAAIAAILKTLERLSGAEDQPAGPPLSRDELIDFLDGLSDEELEALAMRASSEWSTRKRSRNA